jgi:hypothetical protein
MEHAGSAAGIPVIRPEFDTAGIPVGGGIQHLQAGPFHFTLKTSVKRIPLAVFLTPGHPEKFCESSN